MNLDSPILIPAKIILFGEWAVLQGHPAVGIAVEKFFSCSVENFSGGGVYLESPEANFHWQRGGDKAPPFLEATQRALKFVFEHPFETFRNKKLSLRRRWKLSEGLGSSSAMFLALLALKRSMATENVAFPIALTTSELREYQRQLIDFQGGGSGFDLVLQAAGGTTSMRDGSAYRRETLPLPPELLLVHTGKKSKTDRALKSTELDPKIFSVLGGSCESFLRDRDWERAIADHHEALKKLGVVPQFIDDLADEWIAKGWISRLKTTGAGGGDTLMLWVPRARDELKLAIEQLGFWIEEAPPTSRSAFNVSF